MQYRNEKHRKEFEDAVRKCDKNKFALLSALYLLTADSKLWNLSKRFVKKNNIDFNSIYPTNITENGYTLFCCAKDLYLGTRHLSIGDLADYDIISPRMFHIICHAMAIRHAGIIVVQEGSKTNDQSNR